MARTITSLGLFLCLLNFSVLVSPRKVSCPYEFQVCDCYDDRSISCYNKDLQKIPAIQIWEELVLSGNKITEIGDGELVHGLKRLFIWEKSLNKISDNAFLDSADSLWELRLGYSLLNDLPVALMELTNLTSLEWLDNPTHDWNTTILEHVGKTLNTLKLVKMSFQTLPSWIGLLLKLDTLSFEMCNFDSLKEIQPFSSQVKKLKIIDSNITTIPQQVGFFGSLEVLEFTANSISDLTPLTYLKLSPHIKDLSFHGNKISDISPLFYTSNVERLWLSMNEICDHTQIPYALIPHQSTMTWLELSSNCLTEIPDLLFMTSLDYLDLGWNNISDYKSGSFPGSLTSLSLSANKLTSLPPSVSNLSNLYSLAAPRNKIRSIDNFIFPSSLGDLEIWDNSITQIKFLKFSQNVSKLDVIYLYGNPIEQIDADAFINIPQLKRLYISGTKLTRLPIAFRSLTQLSSLSISSQRNLACTCAESVLGKWYKGLKSPRFSGKCGDTEVTYFLSDLVSQCPSN